MIKFRKVPDGHTKVIPGSALAAGARGKKSRFDLINTVSEFEYV